MPENPFLADRGQALALALMSIGGGISQAANSGQGGFAGIAPGAMTFASAMGQARQQKEMEDLRRWQISLQERQIKNAEDERKSQREVGMRMASSLAPPGMRPAAELPTMGPGPTQPQAAGTDLVNYLVTKHGLTPVQAAAAVGNFQQESSFNPTAVHDGGTGYGLAGWRLDRRDALQNYAKLKGGDVADPRLQADFFVDELKTRPEWQRFSQAQDINSASTALMDYFRPAGWTPNNPTAGHGFQNRVQYAQAYGQPTIPQGDNPGRGAPQGGQTRDMLPSLTPEVLQSHDFRSTIPADIKQQAADLFTMGKVSEGNALIAPYRKPPDLSQDVVYINGKPYRNTLGKKSDNWRPLTADDVRVKLGPNANPSVSYQENTITGEIKPIGQAPVAVNINNEQQTEFAKEVGKNDAKRLVEIQNAEHQMSDFASKIRFATEQLGETYTGTGAEGANAWFKALGSLGFEDAGKKANAAAAAQAIISQMKPHMRASGSGASSDKDMDMFAQALPSLVNLPGGNQRIAGYFDKLSERATEIRRLAEEHSAGGTKALSGTQFADAVKKLGPLFTEAERKELQDAAKNKPAAATKERPPLSTIFQGGAPNMTPRPDINTILGRP